MKTERDLTAGRGRAAREIPRAEPSEGLAARALDAIGAIVGLDAGWIVRSATPGLERLTAQPVDTAIGAPLAAVLARTTADATIGALADAVQAGRHVPIPGVLASGRAVGLIPVPARGPSAEIYVVISDVLRGDATDASLERARRSAETAEVFRARLIEVEEQLEDTLLLEEIGEDIAGALDLPTILARVVDHVSRLCRADFVAVETLETERGLITVAAMSGPPAGPESRGPVPFEGTLAGQAIATRTPITVTTGKGLLDSSRYSPPGDSSAFGAGLAVPVVADQTVLGALVAWRRAAEPFGPPEVHRARELAGRVALAIRNAQRYDRLHRQLDELRATQADTVQAEKLAAVGRLAAGTAHEINNPLAAIVGNAELLLRRETLLPAAQERVDRILQGAYRAARIIRHLLAFVRAQPLNLAPIDVVRLLRELVAAQAHEFQLDRIRIVDELAPLPPLPADAQQLTQVFTNLLDNARDALREVPEEFGGRLIRLSSSARPGSIEIRVENSGSRIADEILPKIFDPFFTTKAVGRGAGLGLSVCEGIVAAHGGRIHAENLPQGAAFVIELPAAGEPAPATD